MHGIIFHVGKSMHIRLSAYGKILFVKRQGELYMVTGKDRACFFNQVAIVHENDIIRIQNQKKSFFWNALHGTLVCFSGVPPQVNSWFLPKLAVDSSWKNSHLHSYFFHDTFLDMHCVEPCGAV